MRWSLTALAVAACSNPTPPTAVASAEPSASSPAEAVHLDGYAWSRRPLLVFARSREALATHRARWDDAAAGLEERDMVVLEIVGDDVHVDGDVVGSGAALRERFSPTPPLTQVLIGKDGGEKLRGSSLGPDEVFATIDRMPMRRREMKDGT